MDKPRPFSGRTYFQACFRSLFELILRPLLGLSWNTDICRTEELRTGCFSICWQNPIYSQPKTWNTQKLETPKNLKHPKTWNTFLNPGKRNPSLPIWILEIPMGVPYEHYAYEVLFYFTNTVKQLKSAPSKLAFSRLVAIKFWLTFKTFR